MRILFAGNFNIEAGTGYSTIIANLGLELVRLGHEVIVLGEYWTKQQHDFPFTVIPSDYNWIPAQAVRMQDAITFDHAILAMDIPKIANLLASAKMWQDWEAPTSGLFPVESSPLLPAWIERLGRLDHRFVISRFGQRVLEEEAGLDSVFLPVTAHVPPTGVMISDTQIKATRSEVRDLVVLGNPDAIVQAHPLLVTVADNQERKDLPTIARAVRILLDRGHPVAWLLVTGLGSPYGWHFPQLLMQTGIEDHAAVISWGISADSLSLVYHAADLFVLVSQAEGACLPLYEAMAHGVRCVAPDHTAITEALEGRGVLVQPSRNTIHPFGNVVRYQLDPMHLADAIESAEIGRSQALSDFIAGRPWSATAQIMEDTLNVETTEETAPQDIFERAMAKAPDPVPAG